MNKVRVNISIADEVAQDTGVLAADAPLREQVIHALRTVIDPEMPVNLYDLGLIYRLDIIETAEGAVVDIDMTLTAPNCPVAGEMPGMVQAAAMTVPGVARCSVKLVWTPKWGREHMSEAARLELGLF